MILEMTRPVQGGLRQEKKYEIIANHLANANTTGFKADIMSFDYLLRARVTTDHSQGALERTGNKLDLAIVDEGFFSIQTQNGVRYTRNGGFTLDNQGQIVTQSGDTVLGDGGPVIVEGSEINVSENGEIQVDGEVVGKLAIVTFESMENLEKEVDSLFRYKGEPADVKAPEKIVVRQGTLEMPNFSTVVEMTKLIEIQRMYEAYQKMIHTFDEIDSKAVSEVGRLQ